MVSSMFRNSNELQTLIWRICASLLSSRLHWLIFSIPFPAVNASFANQLINPSTGPSLLKTLLTKRQSSEQQQIPALQAPNDKHQHTEANPRIPLPGHGHRPLEPFTPNLPTIPELPEEGTPKKLRRARLRLRNPGYLRHRKPFTPGTLSTILEPEKPPRVIPAGVWIDESEQIAHREVHHLIEDDNRATNGQITRDLLHALYRQIYRETQNGLATRRLRGFAQVKSNGGSDGSDGSDVSDVSDFSDASDVGGGGGGRGTTTNNWAIYWTFTSVDKVFWPPHFGLSESEFIQKWLSNGARRRALSREQPSVLGTPVYRWETNEEMRERSRETGEAAGERRFKMTHAGMMQWLSTRLAVGRRAEYYGWLKFGRRNRETGKEWFSFSYELIRRDVADRWKEKIVETGRGGTLAKGSM
ncbi:MAG: hypothetical protein M1831_003863 [Alyxoria varia]|nr:MAG: hypothetical protein M1831_003863 [Alyxoria varia]